MDYLICGNGQKCLIDSHLYEYLSKWKWTFDGRYVSRRVHIKMDGKRQVYKKIYLHAAINQTPEGLMTDHINGDKLDNRLCNLRTVNRSRNESNKPKKRETSSKYRGVSWFKLRNKWKAEIKRDKKKTHLGLFANEEDAARAFDAAAKLYGGDYRLNFE